MFVYLRMLEMLDIQNSEIEAKKEKILKPMQQKYLSLSFDNWNEQQSHYSYLAPDIQNSVLDIWDVLRSSSLYLHLAK